MQKDKAIRLSLIIMAASAAVRVNADIIDFEGLDLSPISAGNPYAGVLNLQAGGGFLGAPDPSITITEEVGGGVVFVAPTNLDQPIFLEGTFLQPVSDVSLKALVNWMGALRYSAQNASGDVLTFDQTFGDPFPPTLNFAHLTLTAPSGYYVTSFGLSVLDLGGTFLFVDDIAFNVVSTPDGSTTAMLLGLSCVGLAGLKRRFA